MSLFYVPKRRLRSWRPVYGPRLLIVLAAVIVGSLPPPKAAPAAIRGPAALPRRHQSVREIWPLTPEPPPQLAEAEKAESKTPEIIGSAPAATARADSPQPPAAPAAGPQRQAKIVAGWLPFWDIKEGMRVIDEFPGAVNEVSPFWYELSDDGGVVDSPGAENSAVLAALKSQNTTIIPTIAWAKGAPLSAILNDAGKRAAHIRQIMAKVKMSVYDGIDIDYENLPEADRDIFSRFVRELAARVHKRGKNLVVTVNAKTSEPGEWNGARSHDYAAIGAYADYVRVMAYDQHYSAGPPGPIAGIDWVEKVISFSLTRIPKEKLVLGVPLYGYDWGPGRAKSLVHDEAAAKSLSRGAPIVWDEGSASSFFKYSDDSGEHTVWFENSRSLEAKIRLAAKYDLAGVAIWRLGREDKAFYRKIRSVLDPLNH